MKKTIFLKWIAILAGITISNTTMAQSNSWNLSRDMMTSISTNPTTLISPATGIWSFQENMSGAINPPTSVSYTLLPTYSVPCSSWSLSITPSSAFNCWQNTKTSSLPSIGVSPSSTHNFNNGLSDFNVIQGMPVLHPENNSQAIISWKSPVKGTVTILGRISDIDNACGDGVQWRIRKSKSSTSSTLIDLTAWKTIVNPATSFGFSSNTFFISTSVAVGTKIYFVVDKNGSQECDSTSLDVLIAKK